MTFAHEQSTVFALQNSLNPQLPLLSSSPAYGLGDPLQTTQLSGASSTNSAIFSGNSISIHQVDRALLLQPGSPGALSGNSITTATNLGALNGRRSENGSVSSSDRFDFYRFNLTASGRVDLTLGGTGSGDADIFLIRDTNSNGSVESDEILAESVNTSNSEALFRDGLASGTYYALVHHFSGGSVNYNLTLTADTAGNSPGDARNLGTLTGSGSVSDFVGFDDADDFYRFNLSNSSNLSLSLTGLSDDADLYLYRDGNQNGILEFGELLEQSINFGNASELLSLQNLTAGSYFIHVEQFSGNTNYTLGYSASPAEPGSTLATATDLGTVTGRRSLTGSVSSTDQSDIYRFTNGATSDMQITLSGLTGDADLYLIRDSNNNGNIDAGETLEYSIRSNSFTETITVSGLATGNYFVDVRQYSGSTNYTLTFEADTAGKTLATARNLGTLPPGTRSFNDFIGEHDATDYYRFTTTATGNLTLRLDGMTADGDLYLIRDSNNNGVTDPNEIIALSVADGSNPEGITFYDLAAGNYYVEVRQYSGNTNYKLDLALVATRPDPGNILRDATNLGTLAGQRFLTESLSGSDREDLYRLNLSSTSDLSLALTGLSNNADLFLIRDLNNNGIVDAGDVLQSSTAPGSQSEFINFSNLAAGNYFVGVRGDGSATNYSLRLTADAAGSTLATARNIGSLSGFRSFTDFIGQQDQRDFYRFSLNTASNVSINLPGLTADMDLFLGRDANGNGVIDAGETLAISATDGNSPESITINNLASGAYYVWVEQFSGEGNYTLNLSSVPA